MAQLTEKQEKIILRLLEILPGFVSWNLILLPYWGIIVFPTFIAYFILFFNVYWFYQSLQIAVSAIVSHLRVHASINYDWLKDLETFPDWKKVNHVVIVPTYKEPLHILERTLGSIANQDLPKNQITVVLGMEEREPEADRISKAKALEEKFGKVFKNFLITTHKLTPQETIGKHSNQRHAALIVKKELIDTKKLDINYLTVTSCDSDHRFHPKHFSNLTFKFLDNPKRYRFFWQPLLLFYNNIWEIPAITRVPNTLMSIWNLSQLPRRDRLINAQNYSLSFKLLDEIDYWDPEIIPEDWRIFFKAYYKTHGEIEVEPLYLPVYADAAQSDSLFKTLKNQYEQIKRWAWGVSDDPWIIKNYLFTPNVPFWDKTMRLLHVIWMHFLWPVNWFIITLGITFPSILNPAFARTTLGYSVPKLSSFVLTVSLVFLLITLILDYFYKPREGASTWKLILAPFEFVLMPIAGFFFSALPGLDAHTRLMLGKYLEYRVTEKV